jgi:hypothetical protein
MLDLLRQRRLGNAQLLRRSRKAAGTNYRAKIAKLVKFHVDLSS